MLTLYIRFRSFKFKILHGVYSILPDFMILPQKLEIEIMRDYTSETVSISHISRKYASTFHRCKILERYNCWDWIPNQEVIKIVLSENIKIKIDPINKKYKIPEKSKEWQDFVFDTIELNIL